MNTHEKTQTPDNAQAVASQTTVGRIEIETLDRNVQGRVTAGRVVDHRGICTHGQECEKNVTGHV
jgi:hypothetical protein